MSNEANVNIIQKNSKDLILNGAEGNQEENIEVRSKKDKDLISNNEEKKKNINQVYSILM